MKKWKKKKWKKKKKKKESLKWDWNEKKNCTKTFKQQNQKLNKETVTKYFFPCSF